MKYIYWAGCLSTLALAGLARMDKNYGEMRAHLISAILFASLYLDKVL